MSFLDHIEQLRWHIIRSFIAIGVFAMAAFLAKDLVFHTIILGPSRPDFWTYRMLCMLGQKLPFMDKSTVCIEDLGFTLQSRQMTGQFTMHMTSSLVIGIILAFPYTFWEIWRFIKPGLHPTERNLTRGTVFFVSFLFLGGILFGYFMVSPLSINFLASYKLDEAIINEFDIISYVSTVTMIVLACGIMFQLPIVVLFLSKAGIITPAWLRAYRKHSLMVMLVLSAILTPPDIFSQILVMFPLVILYEVSITISGYIYKGKLKALKKLNDERD